MKMLSTRDFLSAIESPALLFATAHSLPPRQVIAGSPPLVVIVHFSPCNVFRDPDTYISAYCVCMF
jgi:hypothetical protein